MEGACMLLYCHLFCTCSITSVRLGTDVPGVVGRGMALLVLNMHAALSLGTDGGGFQDLVSTGSVEAGTARVRAVVPTPFSSSFLTDYSEVAVRRSQHMASMNNLQQHCHYIVYD